MDFRQLRYFVAIVDSGTLTEAAHRLHVVQSTLSQRLAALEESMGVQLLVRSRSGLTPTEAGRELYSRARLILKQGDAARAAVREKAQAASGPLRIGLLRSVAPVIGTHLYRAIRTELPQVRPLVTVGYSEDLLRQLRTAALDLALGVQQASDSVLEGTFLFSERVCLLGAPRFFRSSAGVAIEDLRDVPLLVSSARGPIHQALESAAAQRGIALQVVGSLEDHASVIELCTEGVVATYVPESTALHLLQRHPGLAAAPLLDPSLARKVYCYTHSDVPRTGAVVAVERLVARLVAEHVRLQPAAAA